MAAALFIVYVSLYLHIVSVGMTCPIQYKKYGGCKYEEMYTMKRLQRCSKLRHSVRLQSCGAAKIQTPTIEYLEDRPSVLKSWKTPLTANFGHLSYSIDYNLFMYNNVSGAILLSIQVLLAMGNESP